MVETMTRSVLKVGEGRGFVIGKGDDCYVVTAAHCLPHLPPPISFSANEERTYKRLLGDIGSRKHTIWAECLFVDPIADIAVLGKPDGQEFYDEAGAFDELVDGLDILMIGVVGERASIRLLDLDGQWFDGIAMTIRDGPIWLSELKSEIAGGMSGSPILLDENTAVGIVGASTEGGADRHGPQARLSSHLPGWLLRQLAP